MELMLIPPIDGRMGAGLAVALFLLALTLFSSKTTTSKRSNRRRLNKRG